MTAPLFPDPAEGAARVLIVDDDRRVIELLSVALSGRGYEVLTAGDGEEAIRQTLGQRPDLVVLDVRLPRRSGFEVCELLRRDADLAHLPIVMVSAAGEPEARLQAFARGADDYLTKPFSPRELLARIQRLLVRARDAREARLRTRELERELHRAQDETRRGQDEIRRRRRFEEIAIEIGPDLQGALDPDLCATRLVEIARERIGLRRPQVLLPDPSGARFVPQAARHSMGRGPGIDSTGEIATLLSGFGRPVARAALERLIQDPRELPPLFEAGVLLLAPVSGREGLEAVLLAEGGPRGSDLDPETTAMLAALCDLAAVALSNARRVLASVMASIATLAPRAEGPGAEFREEAWHLTDHAATGSHLTPRAHRALRAAVTLGPWGLSPEGRDALQRLAAGVPTGTVRDLLRVIDSIERPSENLLADDPDLARAAVLAAFGLLWAVARDGGAAADPSLVHEIARGALLDPAMVRSLEAATMEPAPIPSSTNDG